MQLARKFSDTILAGLTFFYLILLLLRLVLISTTTRTCLPGGLLKQLVFLECDKQS